MFLCRTNFLFLWFLFYLWIYIKRINCLTEYRAPCRTLPALSKEQIELCYRFPDVTYAALEGLEMAIKECQFQFQWNRWNCSSLSTKSRNPHTSNLLKKGYRESAFAYAISAAGVAHSVARACSQGKLLSCGCDPSINRRRMSKTLKEKLERDRKLVLDNFETTNNIISEDYQINEDKISSWKWGGCSHNMDFGIEFSEMFLDSREKAHDIQSKINLHNNNAGRKAVFNNMHIRCKCHGMSGSCQLKTCWKSAPEFRIVGKMLKKQFRRAVLVDQSNMANGKPVVVYKKPKRNKNRKNHNRISSNNANNYRRNHNSNNNNNRNGARGRRRTGEKISIKEIKRMEQMLFYYERSPNFCERDLSSDILGTLGRKCNRTSVGSDGCDSMCCGRGYNLVREHRVERCNCKFNWCCYVECDNCEYDEWMSVCN